jgi:Group II intron, maturase-specific domain
MHRVRHLRQRGEAVRGLSRSLAAMNRKQGPVGHACHRDIHRGRDDGESLAAIADRRQAATPVASGPSRKRSASTRRWRSGEPTASETGTVWFGGGRLETQVMLCAGRLPYWAVFCPTQEKAIEAQHLLATWLETRGLKLSDEKTHIRHLRKGFNFLGCNIRYYPMPHSSRSGDKLLIKPSADSVKQLKRKLKGLWRKHVGTPTVALINEMNPVIRGWSNYFRTGVAKETFSELDNFMYYRAQRYMKRRHPRKSGWWRTQKYWGRSLGRQDRWVFQDKIRHATLRKFAWTKIVRHRPIRATYSPDDPTL